MNLLPLHRLAAERLDGLHPKLRELLDARSRLAATTGVEELALHRGDPHIQAGPHPAGATEALPDNVVRLPAPPNQRNRAIVPAVTNRRKD